MSGRIQVSDSVLLIFAAALILDTSMLTILFLIAAIIHEIGHLIAVWLCSGEILRIKLTVFGGVIDYHNNKGKSADIIIAAAGPLMGLITAYFSAKSGFFTFSGANFILSVINLLPVLPLDGGRILEQILPIYIVKYIGFAVKIIITILGIYIMFCGKGCSLILFSCVLWFQSKDRGIAKHIKIG